MKTEEKKEHCEMCAIGSNLERSETCNTSGSFVLLSSFRKILTTDIDGTFIKRNILTPKMKGEAEFYEFTSYVISFVS